MIKSMSESLELNLNEIRRVSSDGYVNIIYYDLSGMDLRQNSRYIASSLAKDVFEFAASKWISFIDNEFTFLPDSQVTIRWPFGKGVKTNSLEEKFLNHLRRDNVIPHFQKQIDLIPSAGFSAASFLVGGVAGAVVDEMTNSSNAKAAFIAKIMTEIKKNISFEYRE